MAIADALAVFPATCSVSQGTVVILSEVLSQDSLIDSEEPLPEAYHA